MNLDTTTRSLEILLGGTVATNQLKVTSDYVDIDQSTLAATADACTPTTTNNTSAVTIVAAPGSGKTRRVTNVEVVNIDTASATVTIQLNDNSTIYKKVIYTLLPNATLQYTNASGWTIIGVSAPTATGVAGINTQTGTSYTLALTDSGYLITLSNASPITLTVPTNASVAFPVGTAVYPVRYGAGTLTIAAAGGVTINNGSSLTARVQNSVLCLIKVATDTWIVFGDMT